MFGKVISIDDNFVTVENLSREAQANYLNIHVVQILTMQITLQ